MRPADDTTPSVPPIGGTVAAQPPTSMHTSTSNGSESLDTGALAALLLAISVIVGVVVVLAARRRARPSPSVAAPPEAPTISAPSDAPPRPTPPAPLDTVESGIGTRTIDLPVLRRDLVNSLRDDPLAEQLAVTGVDDRHSLGLLAIEVVETVPSVEAVALADQLLRSIGWTSFGASGEPLDTSRHRVVDRVPVSNPTQHRHIIELVRPGWQTETGTVVQPARVRVGMFG